MLSRSLILIAAILLGALLASWFPAVQRTLRGSPRPQSIGAEQAQKTEGATKAPDDRVQMTAEQIAAARIKLTDARPASISQTISVPGSIISNSNKTARVAVKLQGIIVELRKNLGDPVAKGEIVAVLESREIADAKTEHLSASLANELQQTLFTRDVDLRLKLGLAH